MGVVIAGPNPSDPSYLQDQIDDLAARKSGFFTQVSAPTSLVQITHDTSWTPAGVLCIDTLDQITEPASITHPQPGVTEVAFGVDFTGRIFLS
ncbi:hypothetical protein WHI96_07960 [Pseudonocardia tropica]|uniref:Uncharacterized protein n=1 Tax=Pseudonocardia tropica TaxID=681289 RepID=A0ABV1JS29_9PSEU